MKVTLSLSIYHYLLSPVSRSDERPPGMRTVAGSMQYSFVEIGHEIISTAIFSLQLIEVGSCQLLSK